MTRALVLSGGGARGAFQAGVWKYLQENNWQPDIICGTSVGAINAAAIGTGMAPEALIKFWSTFGRHHVYRLTLKNFARSLLFRRSFSTLMETAPLKSMLATHLDLAALKNSTTDVVITAVNMETSKLETFDRNSITIEHIMAATAMPMFFPWQMIDGVPYWDGGVVANTPIAPALEREADEIIVVLLSPVGASRQPLPKTPRQTGELVFEHFLIGSYHTCLSYHEGRSVGGAAALLAPPETNPATIAPAIHTVAPQRMLGFRSLLNFSTSQARHLIIEGYRNAHKQLGHLF